MNIPSDVLNVISSYIIKHDMKLLDVIEFGEIYDSVFSKYGITCQDMKYVYTLSYKSIYFASKYPEIIQLIKDNINKINLKYFYVENSNIIYLLKVNKCDLDEILENPNGIYKLLSDIEHYKFVDELYSYQQIFEIDKIKYHKLIAIMTTDLDYIINSYNNNSASIFM